MTNALWALKGETVWFHGWVTRVSGLTGIGQKRNFTGKPEASWLDLRYDGRGHLPQLSPFEAGASSASGDDEVRIVFKWSDELKTVIRSWKSTRKHWWTRNAGGVFTRWPRVYLCKKKRKTYAEQRLYSTQNLWVLRILSFLGFQWQTNLRNYA